MQTDPVKSQVMIGQEDPALLTPSRALQRAARSHLHILRILWVRSDGPTQGTLFCILPGLDLSDSCSRSPPCKKRKELTFQSCFSTEQHFNWAWKNNLCHFLPLTFKGSFVFPWTLVLICNLNLLWGAWHFKTDIDFWSEMLILESTHVTKPSPCLSWCYFLRFKWIAPFLVFSLICLIPYFGIFLSQGCIHYLFYSSRKKNPPRPWALH